LINPTFNEYKHYFDSTRLNNFKSSKIFLSKYFINLYINIIQNNIKTKFKKSRLHAIYYLNSSNDEFFDLNNKEFVNEVMHKIVVTYGWLFRDITNFKKHSDKIKEYFTPSEKYYSNSLNILKNIRKEDSCIVGIHIRRGDYESWRGGMFYYDDLFYIKLIKYLSKLLLKDYKSVEFLVCSDEGIIKDLYSNCGCKIHYGTNNEIEDLYCFALCDLLVGPPSTYTIWASFYGQVPLYQVTKKALNFQLKDFNVEIC
jgi:hypothetical protein